MARSINDPMSVEYENDEMILEWNYKIVETKRGNSKQYSIAVNERFRKLTGIRQALFISKSQIPNHYIFSTTEPPEDVEYQLEKPHDSRIHIKINLPKKIMKLSSGDKIRLRYFPDQKDVYNLGGPRIEAIVYRPEKEQKCTGKIETRKDTQPKIRWEIHGNIPEDLYPLLSPQHVLEIEKQKDVTVIFDVKTLDITILAI